MDPELKANLDSLDGLGEKGRALRDELRQSVTIQSMVPEAFAHGTARLRWRHTAKGLRGILIDGNGTEHELPDDAAERLDVRVENLPSRQLKVYAKEEVRDGS